MTPALTPNNLKLIGFVEMIDPSDTVYYERNGLKIFFRQSHGIDYLSGSPSLPLEELLGEISIKLVDSFGG